MSTVKIASLFATAILILLGVLGLIMTHRLVLTEMELGLLNWEDDSIFMFLAYGIPIGLAFCGAMGAANVLSSSEV